jgi:flagellar protein FlbD
MIELTRLNGTPILLNSDLIKTAEASPDTMLTLINGEKLIVREELGEVLDRVLAYRAILLATVARKLSPVDTIRRAASLTSMEFAGELRGPDLSADVCIEQQREEKGR